MEIDPKTPISPAFSVTEDRLFGTSLLVIQPADGHRAGTDAVLLAAATPAEARRIADLGAASGVVGLRAAQLNPEATVTLVERDAGLAELAWRNIALNGLEKRATALEADVMGLSRRQDLRDAFDLVLTNPPFMEAGTVRVSPKGNRASAHVMAAPLDDWVRNAVAILAPKGRLVMIHRADALEDAVTAFGRRLGEIRVRFVHPRADAPATRLLISARKGSRAPLAVLPPLVLHDEEGRFLPRAAALHRGEARL
ncbi:MAG TPA: methyltransferase [Rhabdaerophilum sp.]|nr:methyltransferase [Rhabdaerophilum sp.]